MKVLVIHNPFLGVHINGNNFGGIETYVNGLVNTLLDNGHEVTLIATADSTAKVDNPNFKMFLTESASKAVLSEETGNPKARFPYGQYCKLIQEVGIENFDLVINNSDKISINNTLFQISKKKQLHNVVTYLHNPPIYMGSDNTCKRFYSMSDYIMFVANSDYNFRMWNNMSRKLLNHDLIVDVNPLRVEDVPYEAQSVGGVDFTKGVCVGRLTGQKNPVLFRNVAKELPDMTFSWFGILTDDPACANAMKDVPSNLEYKLSVPKPDKFKFLIEHRPVMISFSVWETYGITAPESFAMGLPIIVLERPDNNIMYFVDNYKCDNEYEDDRVIVNPLGIIIRKSGAKNPVEIAKSINHGKAKYIELFKDSSSLIREYFDEYCKFNMSHIEAFVSINQLWDTQEYMNR